MVEVEAPIGLTLPTSILRWALSSGAVATGVAVPSLSARRPVGATERRRTSVVESSMLTDDVPRISALRAEGAADQALSAGVLALLPDAR